MVVVFIIEICTGPSIYVDCAIAALANVEPKLGTLEEVSFKLSVPVVNKY